MTGVGDGNCVHRVLVPCNPLWPDAVPCGQKRLKELHTAVTENRQELKQEMKDRYDRENKAQDQGFTVGQKVLLQSHRIKPRSCLLYTSPSPRD